ncbi:MULTISPECIES: winged helix-turn-helix domain-containing protein [unclassified Amycolatopsis]|uniref:winged helix-turn-helix domain-containing protein n=1 Tax=unclassified Amycolatopsis TaxID=2618356 RepID=UPI00287646DC|nr:MULTISPECIES: winged helix-turn-helix domain-containing protein [unclassified Amycolatopsis]MDS0135963.1 winged helix-turn-helix transcriptional regulator [Amycolatopsis sp. 505]MDS0145448.1 winged helix-turn-helix transcriptional regulator [Amycolatopsis sp. CM201R]
MTTQPAPRANSEVVHLDIRIDLTGRAADAALVATRLTTAFDGLASVDVTTARPRRAAHLTLVSDPLLRIETESRRAVLLGSPLTLTRLEFDLLRFLRAHPDRVFTRAALKSALWPQPHGGDRTVDVHVRKLRAKLEPHLDPITTIRGVGYRFEGSAPVALL